MDGLHEHERSSVPFHSKALFQSFIQELFEKPDTLIFGNEAATQALVRFKESVELIWSLYNNKLMAIVSHGTMISLFTSRLAGVDGYQFWSELGLPSFVVLDLHKKKLLETVNIS
jgi:broad specificity phosphatase PhoE